MRKGTGKSDGQRLGCLFVFMESKAGFMLNKPGGDGRIAGKPLQIEQGNVRKLIANKIDLTLFSPSFPQQKKRLWLFPFDLWCFQFTLYHSDRI